VSTTKTSATNTLATSATSGRSESSTHLKGGPNLDMLKRLFEVLDDFQIAELEWEHGDERIRVKTGTAPSEPVLAPSVHATHNTTAPTSNGGHKTTTGSSPTMEAPLVTNQKQILSPFVGTFYRSPSPDGEPYAKEGQTIKKGDSLCIVEAMKLMNEIESELNGVILKVLVQNGQPVEFGEPLFLIEIQ
jgi:acetyl-CoA carboxylase biotin carboxyl carrier protein